MKKYKLDKTKLAAILLSGTTFLTSMGLVSCGNKEDKNIPEETTTIETVVDEEDPIVEEVGSIKETIKKEYPELNDDIAYDTAIMLMLKEIAKEDENGKIYPDEMEKLKSIVNPKTMLNNYNSFLNTIQGEHINGKDAFNISTIIPEEYGQDKKIIATLEKMLETLKGYVKEGKSNKVVEEFNKWYSLFVKEEKIEVDGLKFEVRDLYYSYRTVANELAEAALIISKDYLSKDQIDKMDNRLNDQNNKAYNEVILEKISNQMDEESEIDVIKTFYEKSEALKEALKDKVNLNAETIYDLVSYLNLNYLTSDKVATKDRRRVFENYSEEDIDNIVLAVEAIFKYDINNVEESVLFSSLLFDEYANTDAGKNDKAALDYVLFNAYKVMYVNEFLKNDKLDDKEINQYKRIRQEYFEQLYRYFTKQDLTYIDADGKEIKIAWKNISEGANLVNDIIILYVLRNSKELEHSDNYTDITQINFNQEYQGIQNRIINECKKVDYDFEENAKQKVLG